MRGMAWFLCGVVVLFAVAVTGGVAFLMGAHGFSAREQPSALERWIVLRARSMAADAGSGRSADESLRRFSSSARRRRGRTGPITARPAMPITAAATPRLESTCIRQLPTCEGRIRRTSATASCSTSSRTGFGLTGMPAWSSGSEHDTEDSWKLVRFIRHLPMLTAEEAAEMQELNPKSPDELKEEQEEQEFLNGDQPHEHTQHEHH